MTRSTMFLLSASIAAGILLTGQMGSALAADVTVCPFGCNYANVQAGIDAAVSGDRVVVGTTGRTTAEIYKENIVMKAGVELISEGDDTPAVYTDPFGRLSATDTMTVLKRTTLTIIQGVNASPVVSFQLIDDSAIDGFIIENKAGLVNANICLVRIFNSSPGVYNNIIRRNEGTGISGGIRVGGDTVSSQPVIQNNVIHYVNGPGIGISSGAYPTIDQNRISTTPPDTSSTHYYICPGIGLRDAASAIITNNNLTYNGKYGSWYNEQHSAGIGTGDPEEDRGFGIYDSGNELIIRGNTIHHQYQRAAIHIVGQDGMPTTNVNVTIEDNDIHTDGAGVVAETAYGASHLGTVTIRNNTIDDSSTAGIRASHLTDLIVDDNDITSSGRASITAEYIYTISITNNNLSSNGFYAGIEIDKGLTGIHPYDFNIENNTILSSGKAGIKLNTHADSTGSIIGNTIDGSTRGGIVFWTAMTVNILDNEIKNCTRGGIHSGNNFLGTSSTSFSGSGNLNVTVRGNKVHHNGQDQLGGGIDLRHASGVIENNLVYQNNLGGIRFGYWIDRIDHNTVAFNGTSGDGGGIVYDNTAGAVNDLPQGSPAEAFPIRNNIVVGNSNAGINAGTHAARWTCSQWVDQRDFNLLSLNNGTNDSCNDSNTPLCIFRQLGRCPQNANELITAPQFVDPDNDDYHLVTDSVGTYSGEGGVEMGAYGGPNAMNSFEITFDITDDWGSGYCADVIITNISHEERPHPYGVHFVLPTDGVLIHSWWVGDTGDMTQDGDNVTVIYPDWYGYVNPGESAEDAFYFCVRSPVRAESPTIYQPDFSHIVVSMDPPHSTSSTGYCARISLTNNGSELSIHPDYIRYKMPTTTEFDGYWQDDDPQGGQMTRNGENVSYRYPYWVDHIEPGETVTTSGFCTVGFDTPYDFEIVK